MILVSGRKQSRCSPPLHVHLFGSPPLHVHLFPFFSQLLWTSPRSGAPSSPPTAPTPRSCRDLFQLEVSLPKNEGVQAHSPSLPLWALHAGSELCKGGGDRKAVQTLYCDFLPRPMAALPSAWHGAGPPAAIWLYSSRAPVGWGHGDRSGCPPRQLSP